ncbi:MAG: ABC transporter ATP-binding protein [Acidimicrobiia bacterium]|nr:ABC transporter ATP-binding protein [Acidimicrobiia bacterium]
MWQPHGVEEDDQLDRDEVKWVVRRALSMLRPYKRQVAFAITMTVLWTLGILAGPYLVGYGIDHGITPGNVAVLNATVAAYVVVAALSYVVFRQQVLAISRVGESFLRDLRLRVFEHLQRLSMPFYDREKSGVLVSRMTSDVDALQQLVQGGLLMFVMNALLLTISAIVLTVVSWQLMLACLVAVPFAAVASIKFQRDSNAAYLTVRDRIGGTLSSLQEGISGVRVIQAFAREQDRSDHFSRTNRELLRRPHALGVDPGVVSAGHRALRSRDDRRRRRGRRLAQHRGRGRRGYGDVLRPHAEQPLRADPTAQSALQHAPVGRRGPEEGLRAPRPTGRGRGASRCRRPSRARTGRGRPPDLRLRRR